MVDTNRVILTVPVMGEFARTVRITATEIAARAEMTLDDIEDVRLAVEEAFVFATGRAATAELSFVFDVAPGVLALEAGPLLRTAPDADPDTGERYARFILESVCDEFAMIDEGETCTLRIVKRAG